MPTSTSDLPAARAVDVKVTDDELAVQLEDGRTLAVPLVWYPRLLHGSKRERAPWLIRGVRRQRGEYAGSANEDFGCVSCVPAIGGLCSVERRTEDGP